MVLDSVLTVGWLVQLITLKGFKRMSGAFVTNEKTVMTK